MGIRREMMGIGREMREMGIRREMIDMEQEGENRRRFRMSPKENDRYLFWSYNLLFP